MNSQRKERQLLEYEKGLEQMTKKEQIDSPMDDELIEAILKNLKPVELTKEESEKILMNIRRRVNQEEHSTA